MIDIQNKRHQRIVRYFEELYKRDEKWNKYSGTELMNEAYMSNYCLSLRDSNKKIIWGMNPKDIRYNLHLNSMVVKEQGIYVVQTFEIKREGKIVGYVDIGQYSSVLLTEEDVSFKRAIKLINLYDENKNIIVEIKDNGIGIKKEDLPFIFERLYRGDKSRHEIEGNGIGLTIVLNILQLHSAIKNVESEDGKGTTFRVYFNKLTNM